MEVEEIIENLKYNKDGKFQKESIIEARKKKEEVTEALLTELDKVANNVEKYAKEEDYFLPLYAMFLLAEFKEKRAFPIITKLITKKQKAVDSLLGGITTEGLDSILASTFDGNVKCLYDIITNLKVNEYIRGNAFEALEILNKYNMITTEDIIKMIDKMLSGKLKEDDSIVISDIVVYISRNQIYDKIELVRDLYNQNRVDIQMIGDYDQFIDDIYGKIDYHEKKEMIEDTVTYLSWWACFNQNEEDKEEDFFKKIGEFVKKEKQKEQLEIKKTKEIGRNDLCPCGSGKKYKKCCMNKKEISIVTPADIYIENSLKDYPKEELLKYYDEETVQIDEKLYQVLKHKAIPMWVDRNYTEEARRNTKNMNEALELIKAKCQKEKINTMQEFDKKIAIHYNFNDIMYKYLNEIDKNKNSYFEDKQCKKIDFLTQIWQIIKTDLEEREFYAQKIIEECFEDDYYIEDAKKIIYKLKEQFPDMDEFSNMELSRMYQEEGCEIEKTLEPIEENIKKYGNSKEIETRKIEIYYENALLDYYETEEKEVGIYKKLWQLVKEFIKSHKIKTEDEYNDNQEPGYYFSDILYRVEELYESDEKYLEQRLEFLNEASTLIELNENSKETIASGLAEYYNDKNKQEEAMKLIDNFIAEFPNNTQAILTKANIYINAQEPQYEKAIDFLKLALVNNTKYDKHMIYSKIALLYDEWGFEGDANEYQKLAMECESEELPF